MWYAWQDIKINISTVYMYHNFLIYMQDSKRDTDVEKSLLDSVGEGKGGMIWGNSIETYILSYVKQIASPG